MSKNPDAFRTISEVAEELDLPQHVLRFWETRFSQIKPMKRAGGRRYYRPDDFDLLQGIRHLLYDQGYTIKGVQKLLKEHGNKYVCALGVGNKEFAEQVLLSKQADKEAIAVAGKGGSVVHHQGAHHLESLEPRSSDEDVVGLPKTPAALRFLKRYSEDERVGPEPSGSNKSNKSLAEEDRQLLQETLYDLLECKRLLDQTK